MCNGLSCCENNFKKIKEFPLHLYIAYYNYLENILYLLLFHFIIAINTLHSP